MDGFRRRGVARRILWFRYVLLVLFTWQLTIGISDVNGAPAPAPASVPAPLPPSSTGTNASSASPVVSPAQQAAEDRCVGAFLSYEVTGSPVKIPPYTPNNLTNQPYSFTGTVTILNLGYEKLENWELSIDFQHREVIATADGVLILSEQTLPGIETSNDTRIVGTTTPSLLTSIDTSHDLTSISTKFELVGTEFGVGEFGNPLPRSMTLVNTGYNCSANSSAPVGSLWYCCSENATIITSALGEGDYSKRQLGDIVMSYDVMNAFGDSYTARVSIQMNDPIGRLDNWNLSWHWTGGELIESMKGGQVLGPNDQDLCVYGLAAKEYSVDFSTYQSCSPDPVIVDLDQYQSIYPEVAIPYCCRNGTLLPDLIDPSKSRSDFQVVVRKLAPHNTRESDIIPPVNWNIGEGYNCSDPVRVSPTELDPNALHSSSAVASWQVVCNAKVSSNATPKKCCVSLSAYYNDSLIPCPTCSCGCTSDTLPWNSESCNPNIQALWLPYQAVLLPPSNRTALAQQLASLHHYATPGLTPCPDNCGVNINWHVYSDYTNGWSARITLFNWDDQPVVNWSAAVQLPIAMPGFQEAYSFNSTKIPLADVKEFSELNNTVFMQGRIDYFNTYLIGKDSTDNPGKLQSILSFDKTKTPGIKVTQGDGFPKKVWFNGEECQMPDIFPTGDGWRLLPKFQFAIVIAAAMFLMV